MYYACQFDSYSDGDVTIQPCVVSHKTVFKPSDSNSETKNILS